ncbi:uncharacterized protein BKCO1_3100063 [Diplodia corticola]|uniref:LDB19 N-terminal domain-containing protein n=1 Tax=Diplodia corticola TaxID=236234 RepID=A0A1J9QY68_9PEZI|nr:uncharacterized protein BKCO1_3100063 [Diplodia corticola]OJD33313.1 hypothetical protein BKCO1_3100063 [Diplodia corticola]
MVFHITLPHPLPPIINNVWEASDVLVPGQIEFSSGLDSTVTSLTLSLVQTVKFETHQPEPSTSFTCFGFSKAKEPHAEERREIDRWSLPYPPTSTLSSTLKGIPFTIVIPGHLPATTSTPTVDLSYHISATVTTSTATSTTSNTTASKPLHIRRLLALPVGLTTLDHRRRFPACAVKTSLSIPAIFQPLDTTRTARLTLLNTAEHWLRVHKLHWRVEEHTRIPHPHTDLEGYNSDDSSSGKRRQRQQRERRTISRAGPHVRTIASGEHHVAPASAMGALYGAHVSELRLDEIEFDVGVPEEARRACSLMVQRRQPGRGSGRGRDGDGDDDDDDVLLMAGEEEEEERQRQQPPEYAWCSRFGEGLVGPHGDGDEDEDEGEEDDCGGGMRAVTGGSVAAGISVSHTLVLEITGKEIRFDGVTGELLSLGPIFPKVYGARYDIVVAEWSHCNDVDSGEVGVCPLLDGDFSATSVVAPPSYESVIGI